MNVGDWHRIYSSLSFTLLLSFSHTHTYTPSPTSHRHENQAKENKGKKEISETTSIDVSFISAPQIPRGSVFHLKERTRDLESESQSIFHS